MGDVFVVFFIAVVLFCCGLVLVIISSDAWRKAGFFILVVGLVLFVMGMIYYPHARDRDNYLRENYSETP